MSDMIVVNLGLPKSGTTTLARALREAGFTVADYRIRKHQTDNPEIRGRWVGGRLYHNYFTTGDPLSSLGEFDAFTEISMLRKGHSYWPQTDFGVIEAIRAHHPGVMFLASSRDPLDHAMSLLRWSDLGAHRLPKMGVPGLPRGFGATNHERARWISAHRAFLRRMFEGAANFLEYDVADDQAPRRIAAFLGRDLPWWGRLNANDDGKSKPKKHKIAS